MFGLDFVLRQCKCFPMNTINSNSAWKLSLIHAVNWKTSTGINIAWQELKTFVPCGCGCVLVSHSGSIVSVSAFLKLKRYARAQNLILTYLNCFALIDESENENRSAYLETEFSWGFNLFASRDRLRWLDPRTDSGICSRYCAWVNIRNALMTS